MRRTGEVMSVPVGPGLLGRVVDPLGNPLDGLGPIEAAERRPLEFKAPGVIQRQPVKEPMHTGLKSIDSMTADRPRPARAHHRRPLDRQDRGRDRHDPEPARRRPRLRLRRGRAEGLDGRPGRRAAARRRRDGVHDRRLGARAGGRADQVDGAVRRLRDGRVLPLLGDSTRSASTTTSRSTRTRIASSRCSCAARRAARRSRATSSTSTRGCSSARASSRTTSAPARSPRSRSSRRRPATSPRTSRRTSSRSPTARSSSSRASSSRACGRRSTSARRSPAWAATRRRRR